MRLIDADKFIEEKTALYCGKCERRMGMKNGKKTFVYEIGDAPCRACEVMDMLDDIDNAPTVEPTFGLFRSMLCETCQAYATNKAIVKLADEYTRPQGEWVEKVETKQIGLDWLTTREIVCSVCGGSGESDENIPQCWKFCPSCGAKMKGGAE